GRVVIPTSAGELRARAVISSAPRATRVAAEPSKFALAQLHLAVDPSGPVPSHHLFTTVPSGSLDWFRALVDGELPEAFGFHLYRSELPGPIEQMGAPRDDLLVRGPERARSVRAGHRSAHRRLPARARRGAGAGHRGGVAVDPAARAQRFSADPRPRQH